MLVSQRQQRGDTIVEVMVAFAVFTLVAMGAITVMNRGIQMTERSLEITLVRQQIDAQAEILRYARDTTSPAWTTIRSSSVTTSGDSCPDTPPSEAFIASVSSAGAVTYTRFATVTGTFLKPETYSRFTIEDTPKAYGMWVVPVRVSADAYDMYIRACWYAPGDKAPTTLGTIVRLYET